MLHDFSHALKVSRSDHSVDKKLGNIYFLWESHQFCQVTKLLVKLRPLLFLSVRLALCGWRHLISLEKGAYARGCHIKQWRSHLGLEVLKLFSLSSRQFDLEINYLSDPVFNALFIFRVLKSKKVDKPQVSEIYLKNWLLFIAFTCNLWKPNFFKNVNFSNLKMLQ